MPDDTRLSVRALLAIHLVIPVCVVVAAVDRLALGGALAAVLPTHPDALVGFTLLFNLPHIVASELILLDGEYLARYGKLALSVAVATFVVAVAAPLLFPARVWFALLLAVTLVHVVGQQVGIAGMLAGLHGTWPFRAWRWGSTAVALVVYAQWTPAVGLAVEHPTRLAAGLWAATAMLTGLVVVMHRRATTADGRAYLWATHGGLLVLVGLAQVGYPCLALLVPRFLHDVTAFAFYGVHDANRNRPSRRNAIHRALAFVPIPPWALGPLLAIGLAAFIDARVPPVFLGVLVGTLSMVHYVLEAVTWRRTGLYRAHVPLAR